MSTVREHQELVDDIRYRADIRGQTQRHSDADIVRLMTQSFRGLRNKLTEAGFMGFINSTTPAALSTSTPSDGEYTSIAYPDDATQIVGVDIELSTGAWRSLENVGFAARHDWLQRGGPPRVWALYAVPTTEPITHVLTPGALRLYPKTDQAYNYVIHYMEEFPELNPGNVTRVTQGYDGDWHEWVTWDVVCKIASADNDSQMTYQIAVNERQLIEQRLIANINRNVRSGPVQPRRAGRRRNVRGF